MLKGVLAQDSIWSATPLSYIHWELDTANSRWTISSKRLIHSIYRFHISQNGKNLFIAHSNYTPSERGWSDAAYVFSQHFTWDYFTLGYGIGLQLGIAYSEFMNMPLWSLSYLLSIDATISLDYFSMRWYITTHHKDEREWKSVPVFGIRFESNIDENNIIFAEAYSRAVEILMDPVMTFDTVSVRAGYIYRGNI